MNNERIAKLREKLFPLLLSYYKEGETYMRAELHAAREWQEIVAILTDVQSNHSDQEDNKLSNKSSK